MGSSSRWIVGIAQVRPREVRGLLGSPEGDEDQLFGGGVGGPGPKRPCNVEVRAWTTSATVEGSATCKGREATAGAADAHATIAAHVAVAMWSQPPGDEFVSDAKAPPCAGL